VALPEYRWVSIEEYLAIDNASDIRNAPGSGRSIAPEKANEQTPSATNVAATPRKNHFQQALMDSPN